MKKIWLAVLALGTLVSMCNGMYFARAQSTVTAAHFNCIVYDATNCPAALEHYSGMATLAIVAGYVKPNDAGGGEYVLNSAGCPDAPSASGTFSAGTTEIGSFSDSGVAVVVGSIINAPGFVPTGTEISATPAGKLEMTEPAIQSTPTGMSTSFTITGANGGTLIKSTVGCFYKTNYRGEPHEWGAAGDGSTDDTTPVEYWLGASGMVSQPNPTTPAANFGPWIPTIPATYLVHEPLFCPPNATIQGSGNQTNNGITTNSNPRVNFLAAPNSAATPFHGIMIQYPNNGFNYGLQAVFGLNAFCRLSGVGVTGNAFELQTTGTVSKTSTTISSVGSVSNAYGSIQTGDSVFAIDSSGTVDSQDGIVVTSVSTGSCPCTVSVSQPFARNATATNLFFFGPDAVDVLGNANTVTIDGFSTLQDGRYDLFCGIAVPKESVTALRVQDTHLQAAVQHGIYVPGSCDNSRFIDNNISQAGTGGLIGSNALIGGDGIYFQGTEASIAGGIVQDSGGAGIRLTGGHQMSVTGVAVINNGAQNVGGDASAGISIDSSHDITICGNHITGNGGIDADSSQIYFNGYPNPIDNINLCGNIYTTNLLGSRGHANASVAPLYVYDAYNTTSHSSTLTNIHIYETASQPAASVISPLAQPILQSAQTPQFTQNQISGLTLSNDMSSPSTVIDISAGSAVDSTNSILMSLPAGCSINTHTNGPGGLDTSSPNPNTTYFIYVIASAAAAPSNSVTSPAPTPSCIASTSPVPLFTAGKFTGTGYQTTINGAANSGNTTVYNVLSSSGNNANPLAGIQVGDAIASASPAYTTTITAFTANDGPSPQPSVNSMTTIAANPIPLSCMTACSNISLGMVVQDGISCLAPGTYVSDITGLSMGNIKVTNPSGGSDICLAGLPGGTQLAISGAQELQLQASPSSTNLLNSFTVSSAYYRLIGVLYTDGGSHVVQFHQDGDTVTLAASVPFGAGTALSSTSSTLVPIPSVPSQVSVEAFGRCAANVAAMIAPGTIPAQVPASAFTTAPGYTVSVQNPNTPTPFKLYTLPSTGTTPGGSIYATANSGTTNTLNCYNDGWVFHR